MRAQVWDPALVLLLIKLNEVTLFVWPWFFFLSSVQLLPGPNSFLAMEELLNAEDGMIFSPKLLRLVFDSSIVACHRSYTTFSGATNIFFFSIIGSARLQ